jgi:hypothetical protein
MWDSDTNFDYLGIVSGEKKNFVRRTCSNFTVPPKGLVLFFDKLNYKKYRKRSIWRNLGNHLNIELGDGSHQKLPQKIEKIINSKKYSHLVWLSQRAWDNSDIDFVWNLSHELQHLHQDIKNHSLSLAGNFLYNNLSGMVIEEPPIQTTVPTEMDAELAAWRTARKLFGKQVADFYVRNNANVSKKQKIFCDLLKHEPDEKYDLFSKTISLLRKYQPQFEDIISQAPSYYRKLGTVDELCKKLGNS